MTTDFSTDQKVAAFQDALAAVVSFASSPEFCAVLNEMWALPAELRHEFVELVFLDPELLAQRGLLVPKDIDIQRSWFADERPTLFCITKKLPPGMGWKVATVTIDNPLSDQDPIVRWRPN